MKTNFSRTPIRGSNQRAGLISLTSAVSGQSNSSVNP